MKVNYITYIVILVFTAKLLSYLKTMVSHIVKVYDLVNTPTWSINFKTALT